MTIREPGDMAWLEEARLDEEVHARHRDRLLTREEILSPSWIGAQVLARADRSPGGLWLQRPSGTGLGEVPENHMKLKIENRIKPFSANPTTFEQLIVNETEAFRKDSQDAIEITAGRLLFWLARQQEADGECGSTELDDLVRRFTSNKLDVVEQATFLKKVDSIGELTTFSVLAPFHQQSIEQAEEHAKMNVIRFQEEGYELVEDNHLAKLPPADTGEASWSTRQEFQEALLWHQDTAELFELRGRSAHVTYPDFNGKPDKQPIGRSQTLIRRLIPKKLIK